ncbi:MAG: ABC transporter substrate-binding protein [Pirellulales bacterium]
MDMAGCGAPGNGANDGAATLIVGRGGEAESLDPIHIETGEAVKVVVNLYDTLVAYDEETIGLVPGLAREWETSDDGLRWTFHLREGVRFHDGTPLDADAVVFSFNRLIVDDNPHAHSGIMPYAPAYDVIEAVRAVDPLTVEFTLKNPSAVFLANLAMFSAGIVSPTAVEQEGADFATHPVGSGPFRFVRWTRDQELILAANEDYWDAPPGVDRLIFIPVIESAVRVAQLRRGEIHIADNLPPAEVNVLADDADIAVQTTPGMNLAYLAIQNERPPLDNVKLRRAIAHAIDKKALIDVAYDGSAQPAVNPLPMTMWSWDDSISDRSYDVERARELVEEAAAESGFALPLDLSLYVMASPRPYMQQPMETAVFIKEALKPIGINVRIVTNEIGQHFQRLGRGEYDLGLAGWSTDNCDPDNFLYQLLDEDNINDLGGNNNCRYRSAAVHKRLLAAQQELDRDRREQLYREAQELIFADAPMVPLVHSDVRLALRGDVKGFHLHPTALFRLRRAELARPTP